MRQAVRYVALWRSSQASGCCVRPLLLRAVYVAWRGWNALQHLRKPVGNWRADYVEDVGFTVIALFDGFVINSALDLGAPIWLVLVIAVLGVVVGRYGVQRARDAATA